MKKNVFKQKPKPSPAKKAEVKKEPYTIPPECPGFDEIPPNFSQNLDLSNKCINCWSGILNHENIVSLDISGTNISSFQGTKNMNSLKSLKFLNTPLANLPFPHISAIYAFGYQLTTINDQTISNKEIQHLQNHPLASLLQEKIQSGWILCQYPKFTINEISNLVCTSETFLTRHQSKLYQEKTENIQNMQFTSDSTKFDKNKSIKILNALRSYSVGSLCSFINCHSSVKVENTVNPELELKIEQLEKENAQLKQQKLKFVGIFQQISQETLAKTYNDKIFDQNTMIPE